MDWTVILRAVGVLGGLGLVFGIILHIAGDKLAVRTDDRLVRVRGALAGANCGACGYAGCEAFATALVEGRVKPEDCPVSNAENIRKALEGENEE